MIHHVEAGAGDVVVLLHAGGVDLRMWDEQIPALAAAYRVIRLDARGHGRSPTPTTPFRQCDDVAEVLRGLGVRRATLVGASMGAGAATDTALEYPGLVAGLVVCGGGTSEPVYADPWLTGLRHEMALARQRRDPAAWIELFLQVVAAGPHRTTADPSVLARCREMVTDTVRNHGQPDAVPPTHVTGSRERLGEIRVPALGLYGDQDSSDPIGMVKRFAAAVAGAELAVVPGAGHLPNMERPAEFNAILLGFLRSAARRAG